MRIGVSALHLLGNPFQSLVNAIQSYGVKAWELVDEDTLGINKRRARVLNELRRTFSLEYVVHAPFADINLATFNPEIRRVVTRRLTKSIEHASLIEAKLWVFHPGLRSGLSAIYPNKDWQLNIDSIELLLENAENNGVRILIENMPDPFQFLLKTPEDFERLYKSIQSEKLGIAFDIGHANTVNKIPEFLEKHGCRIAHIHAHDNSGSFDHHRKIGQGTVDWSLLKSKLAQVEYEGYVIVESMEEIPESLEKLRSLLG